MHAALKNYLALAGGVAEMAKDKAVALSQTVVMQGLTTVTRATGLAEDVRQQGRQNSEAVTALVRFEAARALGRVGLVAAHEVTALQDRVRSLEAAVRQHETAQAAVARAAAAAEASEKAAPDAGVAEKAAPTKRPAAKAVSTKAVPVRVASAVRPAARRRVAAPVVAPGPAAVRSAPPEL